MIEINFDDYFEPEEGELLKLRLIKFKNNKKKIIFSENEDDFDFIDPLILKQFKQANISIEKIHKDIFNFDAKGK